MINAGAQCVSCQGNQLRRRWHSSRYTIYHCCGCSLNFVHPFPSMVDVVDLYHSNYYHEDDVFRRFLIREVERRLKPLLPRGRILDIGVGRGEFLKVCREYEYDAEGVDISQDAVEICNRYGLVARVGNLPDIGYPPEYFDCITLWDVIEHLTQPYVYLQCVWHLLKPGGWFIVKTPNVGPSIFMLANVAQNLGLSTEKIFHLPTHILYFDSYSLTSLLRSTGFSTHHLLLIGRIRSKPRARSFKGAVYQSALDWLNKLGLAGNLLIYARK